MQWRVVLVVVVVVVVIIIGAGHYSPVWNIISRNVCCQLERSTITHHSIYIYMDVWGVQVCSYLGCT